MSYEDVLKASSESLQTFQCENCGHSCKGDAEECSKCGFAPKLITMEQYGNKLPIGVPEGGKLLKNFELKPIDWNVEREIGRTWEEKRKRMLTVGDYLGAVIAHSLRQLGSQDVSNFSIEKKMLMLNEMYIADVFYLYAYLRVLTLGPNYDVHDVQCTQCPSVFSYTVDLNSIDVAVRNSSKAIEKSLTLRDGIQFMGARRNTLVLQPPLFKGVGINSVNQAEIFAAMFKSMVKDIKGEGIPSGPVITDAEVASLSKWDMDILGEETDILTGGPKWEVDAVCPNCNAEFLYVLDWTYANFFSRSSRSSRRRTRSKK